MFFLAVPALIYYLSYIPYLSPTGPVTLQRILRVQQSMLAYHSTPGLGMDHPFYSPWWQWPLILKPMWYAMDSYVPAGFGANIICLGNPAVFYVGALCHGRRCSRWLCSQSTCGAADIDPAAERKINLPIAHSHPSAF